MRELDDAGVLGPTFLTDGQGRITWISRAFTELTGFDLDAAVGRRRSELVAGPFVGSPALAELDASLRECREVAVEFPTRTASGRPYWAALEVRPIVAHPGTASERAGTASVRGAAASVGREQDVTARRAAEERARQALSRAQSLGVALRLEKQLLSGVLAGLPQLVWWKGSDGRYLGCNPAFLAARGLTSLADVVGRLEPQLDVRDDLGRQVAQAEAEVLAGGRERVDVPVTLAGADGADTHLLVTVSARPAPTWTAPGRGGDIPEGAGTAALIGVATDVTRLSVLERELARSQRLDSIGRLAAGLAHEINTPVQYVSDNTRFVLTAVDDALAGLREIDALAAGTATGEDLAGPLRACLRRLDLPFLHEEVPAALAQAMEGLARVADVVRALTAYADPAAGLVDADVNDLVRDAVRLAENRWRDVADTELVLDPDLGRVRCVEADLRQAVLQLLVNGAQAIEDARRGTAGVARGRITVRTVRVAGPDGSEVHVAVADDGVGMPPDVLQRAFDPFFTTRDVGQGSGQGLAFAHATVVVKHGGRVEASSEPGVGTTVTLVVPVV